MTSTTLLSLTIMYACPLRCVLCGADLDWIQYQRAPKHEAHLSHELLAGAAAYEVRPYFPLVFSEIQIRTRLPSHMRNM